MRRHLGAAAADEEVEVATLVRLEHVLDVEPPVATTVGAGGPLAVVREGDWIELDSAAGRLHLDIDDAELRARLAQWQRDRAVDPADATGYRKLYVEHVLQADEGCDFDFLVGCRGAEVPAHSH